MMSQTHTTMKRPHCKHPMSESRTDAEAKPNESATIQGGESPTMEETLQMKEDRMERELAFDQAVQQWNAFHEEVTARYVTPGAYLARIALSEFVRGVDDQPCLAVYFEILDAGKEQGKVLPYTIYFTEDSAFMTECDLFQLGIDSDDLSTALTRDFSGETWVVQIDNLGLEFHDSSFVKAFSPAEDPEPDGCSIDPPERGAIRSGPF